MFLCACVFVCLWMGFFVCLFLGSFVVVHLVVLGVFVCGGLFLFLYIMVLSSWTL